MKRLVDLRKLLAIFYNEDELGASLIFAFET